MPPTPTISVLITSYNYRRYIAEAVDSVLAQRLPATELIVIDDGSSDGSAEFLREHYRDEPRLRVICVANQGQLAAFKTGAEAASGELIALLDADDRWQPNYLERIAAVYQARPDVDFLYTDMRYFGQREGRHNGSDESRDLGISVLMGAFMTRWQATATSAISLRRELATELLDLPPEMLRSWRTRADDCLVCGADILGAHKFYLGEPLALYRAHGSNAWLSRKSPAEVSLNHWFRVEGMLDYFRRRKGIGPQWMRHAKHEFRTKPKPSFSELRGYLWLAGASSLSRQKTLENQVSMWRHYLKGRRLPAPRY